MVVLDWGCGWGRKDAGRIYEASHAEAMDPAADARSLFASGFEGADLPALLRHPDRRVRIRASVLLAKERRDEQQRILWDNALAFLGNRARGRLQPHFSHA